MFERIFPILAPPIAPAEGAFGVVLTEAKRRLTRLLQVLEAFFVAGGGLS